MIGHRSLPVNRTNLDPLSKNKEHVPYVISPKLRTYLGNKLEDYLRPLEDLLCSNVTPKYAFLETV